MDLQCHSVWTNQQPFHFYNTVAESIFKPEKSTSSPIILNLLDGNCPAQSKHHLSLHWVATVIVCNIANFVGFLQLYSRFIPHFEVQIVPLGKLMKEDYACLLGSSWTSVTQAVLDEMHKAILDDPYLK
jgi:hypothetical protein